MNVPLLLVFLTTYFHSNLVTSQHESHSRIRRAPKKQCDASYLAVSDTHTACLESPPRPREGVSPREKKEILDIHNQYRGQVGRGDGQPTAADMQTMIWDEELAGIAQNWARHCIYQHDDRLARSLPGRFSVGQNIAWTTIFNWAFTLRAWQGEVGSFRYGQGSADGGVVGHYTQMVWANSAKLGCGYAFCNDTRHFYVCNYGPTGNLAKPNDPASLNQPYTAGGKGASCPSTFNSQTGLCDCGGKTCYNGGILDVNSCTCQCPEHPWIDASKDCLLNCSHAKDVYICEAAGGPWGYSHCQDAVNVAYDYCPITCRLCPVEGNKYWRGKGLTPATPENHNEGPTATGFQETETSSESQPSSVQPASSPSRPSYTRPTTATQPINIQPADNPINPGLALCSKREPAKCGEPSPKGYWPRSLCSNAYIEHVCPAMCGKCASIGCDDYQGRLHTVGTSWVTPYGKLSCTEGGVTHASGCVRHDTFVQENEVHSYTEDGYLWQCECKLVNSQYRFECMGSSTGK